MKVEIRLIDDDVLLASREMVEVPTVGEEIVIGDETYHTATTPSEIVGDETIIYVRQVSDA